jgi:tetratricopeptide (TPR) repeat protein
MLCENDMQKNAKKSKILISLFVIVLFIGGFVCGFVSNNFLSDYCDKMLWMESVAGAREEKKENDNLIGYISYLNRAMVLQDDDFDYYAVCVDLAKAYEQLGEFRLAVSCYSAALEYADISSETKKEFEEKVINLKARLEDQTQEETESDT